MNKAVFWTIMLAVLGLAFFNLYQSYKVTIRLNKLNNELKALSDSIAVTHEALEDSVTIWMHVGNSDSIYIPLDSTYIKMKSAYFPVIVPGETVTITIP